jgi:hypothetical protein
MFNDVLAQRYEFKHGKLHGTTVLLGNHEEEIYDDDIRYVHVYKNGKRVKQLGPYTIVD